jgi:hypothetical protein
MFASDHERAAAELLRVCAPGGLVLMTTWLDGGFAGELFELTAAFLPASLSARATPAAWGSRKHVEDVFDAAEARPSLAPFVLARAALEPEGQWDAFLAAFEDLVCRFAETTEAGVRIKAEYFVITVER